MARIVDPNRNSRNGVEPFLIDLFGRFDGRPLRMRSFVALSRIGSAHFIVDARFEKFSDGAREALDDSR